MMKKLELEIKTQEEVDDVLLHPLYHDELVFAYRWYRHNYERLLADLISRGIVQKKVT